MYQKSLSMSKLSNYPRCALVSSNVILMFGAGLLHLYEFINTKSTLNINGIVNSLMYIHIVYINSTVLDC